MVSDTLMNVIEVGTANTWGIPNTLRQGKLIGDTGLQMPAQACEGGVDQTGREEAVRAVPLQRRE